MSSSAAATHFWAAADDALGGTSSAALAKWAVRLCSGHTATGHHRTMQDHMETWLGLQHFEAQMLTLLSSNQICSSQTATGI